MNKAVKLYELEFELELVKKEETATATNQDKIDNLLHKINLALDELKTIRNKK